MRPQSGRRGPLKEREPRLRVPSIAGVLGLATKARHLVAREPLIGWIQSMRPSRPLDVLRVGDGAIVTIPGNIDEDTSSDARDVVGDMIEDRVVRLILEVEGASISAPLVGLLTEVAAVAAVAGVHLSLVISDGEAAASVRGSPLGGNVPIFLTGVDGEPVGH